MFGLVRETGGRLVSLTREISTKRFRHNRGTSLGVPFRVFAALLILFLLPGRALWGETLASLAHANRTGLPTPRARLYSSEKELGQTSAAPAVKLDLALERAKSLVRKGKLTEAEAQTRKYLKIHANSASAHFLLGYILFEETHSKALQEERKEGEKALYSTPGAALLRFRSTKARESLAEFTAGARFHPPSAFDLKIVAMDYVLLGDYIDADKWLTLSLKWEPEDPLGWYYLGRIKYNENLFSGAVRSLKQCLGLEPKDVQAEYNLGLSYAALGQKAKAIRAYRNAIDWEVDNAAEDPEPFIDLASLYLDDNQPAKAVPDLVRAIAIAPQVAKAHEELGKAYSLLHDLRKAQQQLEMAVQLSPGKAPLRCMLGQIYRKEGKLDKAKASFARCAALQKTPSANNPMM